MQTRKLGYTDLEFTTVGLGTWAIGGPWMGGWGPQDDDDSIKTILKAIDAGINWIDTAPIYGFGHAEEVVGKALRQTSEKPIIATKCCVLWDDDQNITHCLEPDSLQKECEISLKRLGVETIDIYQIHAPHPDEDLEKGWEQLAKLVEQGKVRYIATSNFSSDQLCRVQKIHPVASLQPPYSMITRDIEYDLLGFCAENDIGVVIYSPMEMGLLTGKFSHERMDNLPSDDHRRNNAKFKDPQFSINIELIEKLKPIAERNGKTCAQLSIAWTLRRPEVTSAIVGARSPDQIDEIAGAGDWNLSAEDVNEIETYLAERMGKI